MYNPRRGIAMNNERSYISRGKAAYKYYKARCANNYSRIHDGVCDVYA